MNRMFLLAFLLLLGACKQKDSAPTYMPITDQRLRDAATAKVGSYFIYQDSATGGIDSFGVISFRQINAYDERDNTTNESISFQSFDSVDGPGIFQTITRAAYRNTIGTGVYIKGINCSIASVILPFIANDSIPIDHSVTRCINHYDVYSVLGVNYNDVYETISVSAGFSSRIHSWFSLQGGLIKFSASDSSKHFTYLLKESVIKK